MTAVSRPTIPGPRRPHGPLNPVPGMRPPLADIAEALIRDAVARYPAARVAAADLDYADAATVHRLIQTAELHIRLRPDEI